jgi:toxin CcdB
VAKYDLHRNPGGAGYLLDVQTDLLEGLRTRIVVPLLPPETAPPAARRLNPVFDLPEGAHVMVTQALAAVPVAILGPPVGSVSDRFADITAALDMVFQGF